MSREKRRTWLLLGALLALSCFLLLLQKTVWHTSGVCVVVQADGEEIARLALDHEARLLVREGKIVREEALEELSGYNIIEVKGGRVRVAEADCPDRVCVHTGWADSAGTVIACLPHRLILTVTGPDASEAVDAVAG